MIVFQHPLLPLWDTGFSLPFVLYLFFINKNLSTLFVCTAETIVNVLDFKKDVGLWHGILTVSVKLGPAVSYLHLHVLMSELELGSLYLPATRKCSSPL